MHHSSSVHVGPKRLSALMFFQLFVFGAVTPVLPLYLKDSLAFSAYQVGIIMSLAVISSILSPLLSVYVVDRKIRAPRLYILIHLVYLLSTLGLFFSRNFESVLAFYLINALCTGPAIGMLNGITFQNLQYMPGGAKGYGAIRVWGTLGWMVAGYLASMAWNFLPQFFPQQDSVTLQAMIFPLAVIGSILCIGFALGIPPGELRKDPVGKFIPRNALAVMLKPSIAFLSLIYLLSSVLDKFYFFASANFLVSLGFEKNLVPSLLTIGQVSEIFMLFALSPLLKKLGYRRVLFLGLLSQAIRFIFFTSGQPWLSLLGVAMNGFVFACLYSVVIMYIDSHSRLESRQGVHQLIQLFIGGASTLIGNLLSGFLAETFRTQAGTTDYQTFWLVGSIGAVLTLTLTFLYFKEENVPDQGT